VPALRAAADLASRHGEDVALLEGEAMRADVAGATYLGGLRQRSSYGLVDPARLVLGLARAAREHRRSERAGLAVVRRRPVPFPPEPLHSLAVAITQRALAGEDETGRRGARPSPLDRFGVGFNT
jgi:hypothetical protein